jgi:hypothetical protein
MPLQVMEFSASDLQDPSLTRLNQFLRRVVQEVNNTQGVGGPVKFLNGINLNGNRIMNVGAAQEATDAITQNVANPLYGSPAQQATMEAVGKNILQSTRRIGDPTQQDPVSSHLKSQGSVPPVVVGPVNYTSTSTTITVNPPTDKALYWPDGTKANLSLSSPFTVTGLSNGVTYYFYPYWDYKTGQIRLANAAGGLGTPQVAFASPNNAANQVQIMDGHTPLSLGPVQMVVGSSGAVGGRQY